MQPLMVQLSKDEYDLTQVDREQKLQSFLLWTRSHSRKWKNLQVLTLVGFELVPLVETFSTALMVTLKEQKQANASRKITRETENHRRGLVPDIVSPVAGELEPRGSSCCRL